MQTVNQNGTIDLYRRITSPGESTKIMLLRQIIRIY